MGILDRLLGKRPTPPGQHGPMHVRRRPSEYSRQLAEKQKMKFVYGLREREFRRCFQRALHTRGVTGDVLLGLLESRLDNVVYRAGLSGSRDQAKQLVLHGHLKVKGRRVNIPSFEVSEGDVVSVKDSPRAQALVRRYLEENTSRPKAEWVAVDSQALTVQVLRRPLREEIQCVANEKMVVELYSK